MTVAFPAIKPSDVQFNGPTFATTTMRSKSGVTSRRRWADKASNATLDISYNNISDSQGALLYAAHKSAQGSVDDLTLPAILFNRVGADLKAFLDASNYPGLKWCFTEGSTVSYTYVAPNVGNYRVQLTAELRWSQ